MSPDHQECERQAQELEAENERLEKWVNDLQSGMYINCAYCGHRYGPNNEVPASIVAPPDTVAAKGLATGPDVDIDWTMADVLTAHVEKCPKHPLSAAKKSIQPLKEQIRDLLEAIGRALYHLEDGDPREAKEDLEAVLPEN